MEPKGADVLAVSASGEILLALHSKPRDSSFLYAGTLARVPLVGGAPREILNDVEWADWSPGWNKYRHRSRGGGPKASGVSAGQSSLRCGWMDWQSARGAGRQERGIRGSPASERRWRGRGRVGSGGQEDEALSERMGQHSGPGLVAGRERNLVHGNAHGRRSIAVCDRPVGESAVAGAGAGRVDDSGCGQRRKRAADARQRSSGHDRAGAGRSRKKKISRGWTGRCREACRPMAR